MGSSDTFVAVLEVAIVVDDLAICLCTFSLRGPKHNFRVYACSLVKYTILVWLGQGFHNKQGKESQVAKMNAHAGFGKCVIGEVGA
jgi:hypothetical protein